MRDEFLKLHDRIDNALAALIATSDESLRRRAILQIKVAIAEAERLLGMAEPAKEPIAATLTDPVVEHAEEKSLEQN